jgi:hypothetical protein
MAKKMWQFKTRNFTVSWFIEKDTFSVRGIAVPLAAQWKKEIRSGKLKCFQSEIRVTCNTTGIILGEAFIGGSLYYNPAEFRDHFGMTAGGHGSYFADMMKEAIAQARERFPAHQAMIAHEVRKKQKVLGVRLNTKAKAKVSEPAVA